MTEKLETISWQEFQRRKEILEEAAKRVELGCTSHECLDLDMLPILNKWDDIPYSFTISSCSGTPKEHGRKEYHGVNGLDINPNATLLAHSYIAHPAFAKFKEFLEDYLQGKADLSRSSVHSLKGYERIYLHSIRLWVPEEVKQAGDLEYLDRFWKEFHNELERFVSKERMYGWR